MSASHAAPSFPFAGFGRGGTVARARANPVLAKLMAWDATWRQRRSLATMELWQIADLGLDVETVRREVARPFWEG